MAYLPWTGDLCRRLIGRQHDSEIPIPLRIPIRIRIQRKSLTLIPMDMLCGYAGAAFKATRIENFRCICQFWQLSRQFAHRIIHP